MANQFEVTPSNVKSRIDGVSFSTATGKVTIKFSIWESRVEPSQLILAQYKLPAGAWTNLTVSPDGIQLNTNITNIGRWQQHSVVWDAFEDIDLISYEGVTVKLQLQDSDTTADDAKVSAAFDFDLSPTVKKILTPITFGKDTTPVVVFEIPSAFAPSNMHYQVVISENADLSAPVETVDSSVDQTGWEFQLDGNYVPLLAIGCPDISALDARSKCRHTLQTPLSKKVYYYGITPVEVVKKTSLDLLNLTPAQMGGYPVNY